MSSEAPAAMKPSPVKPPANPQENIPPPPPPKPETEWPDAAPKKGEDLIFSISCGNSHLHWATHFGEKDDFNPQIFWRTPHLKEEDMSSGNLLDVLSRNLPDDPHDHVFGKSENAAIGDAEAQSKAREVPEISVYVVSTNTVQEKMLEEIWKVVPSRFIVMRGADFFNEDQGRYDTMGTDRLATLTGAVHLHGHPALVFDGGTATTYSATTCEGKILGGGIGPGIQSKFRSLTKDTDALPAITPEEVIARVKEAQEKGKPLPTFARSTREAMMADAFQEFAYKGQNVVQLWIDKAYHKPSKGWTPPEGAKFNSDRNVVCTGGDGDILMNLLQPHYGGVIEHVDDGAPKPERKYVVGCYKHLIHYGIACVLTAQVQSRNRTEAFEKNPQEEHVGKRVAKHFEVEGDDGDNIYRGKVVKVRDGQFHILYDDGDKEDVSTSELMDMLKMYETHGEKKTKKPAAKRGRPKKKEKPAAASKKDKPAKEKATKQQKTSDKENAKKEAKSVDKRKVVADEVPSFPMKTKNVVSAEEAKKPAAKRPASKQPAEAKKKPTKRAKKGAAAGDEIEALVNSSDPQSFVRKRVAKDFDGETYFGTIMSYDDAENPPFWHVEYDDGDEEDFSKKDLIKAFRHYKVTENDDVGKGS